MIQSFINISIAVSRSIWDGINFRVNLSDRSRYTEMLRGFGASLIAATEASDESLLLLPQYVNKGKEIRHIKTAARM